ncbi:MAG: adenosylcobinamide-phosphate synthase CbiB [Roseovarius sp.]
MSSALILLLAALLDGALGEPRWLWDRLPHPAVLMGRAVGWLDATLNSGTARRAKGILALALLSIGAVVLGYALQMLGGVVEVIILAVMLAQRSLVEHVDNVALALRQSLPEARRAVAQIVGRDTAQMDGPSVARGAIESAAENFSDGVIAPAFWFLVAGLPGLLLYKITNTADSMIGYRTPRHQAFGWAAARFDDVLNVIPARLTSALIALTHGVISKHKAIASDARLHRSPNAGWPEAAMARALNVALAGPRSYDGQMRDFAFVNARGQQDIGPLEVHSACTALWRSWGAGLAVVALIAVVLG